jgi:hypothetical protein
LGQISHAIIQDYHQKKTLFLVLELRLFVEVTPICL